MSVWIVFEYGEYVNKVVGVYSDHNKAALKHKESPTWRYIEEYEMDEQE